ncbi:beta-casein [Choloepus didactylus]|uniref:beta-casein n=1 Tax=Choloepus didactylus TaxID=27675 RepID=UPI0018A026C7|nr:beta-casein [Choloepus didactylus]
MKVLILACLVALALAKEKEELSVSSETAEILSSSEESITQVNKQKLEKVKHDKQQREEEFQDKIHPFIQPQPLIYPFAKPLSYPVLQQNILPLAQPAMMLPFLQPEMMGAPKDKDSIPLKHKVMPILKSPTVPFPGSQILTLNGRERLYLPQPLLQPFIQQQQPQPFPQSSVMPSWLQLSLPQPQILPVPQQMMPYPQREMPVQAFLLYQEPVLDPTEEFSMTQQLAQVYNPITIAEPLTPKQLQLLHNQNELGYVVSITDA